MRKISKVCMVSIFVLLFTVSICHQNTVSAKAKYVIKNNSICRVKNGKNKVLKRLKKSRRIKDGGHNEKIYWWVLSGKYKNYLMVTKQYNHIVDHPKIAPCEAAYLYLYNLNTGRFKKATNRECHVEKAVKKGPYFLAWDYQIFDVGTYDCTMWKFSGFGIKPIKRFACFNPQIIGNEIYYSKIISGYPKPYVSKVYKSNLNGSGKQLLTKITTKKCASVSKYNKNSCVYTIFGGPEYKKFYKTGKVVKIK